jgi:hypothetical protein
VARKYDAIDERLLQWLRSQPPEVTTAAAFKALEITDETTRRHVSRRFSLLEDKGAISCQLFGATRICTVSFEQLPDALHKGGPNNRTWRNRIRTSIEDSTKCAQRPSSSGSHPSIPANNSSEFEAAGGQVERLPSRWDQRGGVCPLGSFTLLDHISELE